MMKTIEKPAAILIVEGDRSVRKLVDAVLSAAGYRTFSAEDGPEALSRAEDCGPLDLVITDLLMAGMNGFELCTCLAATRAGLNVLFMSGGCDVQLRADHAFLAKPFSARELLQKVQGCISSSRALDTEAATESTGELMTGIRGPSKGLYGG